MLLFAMFRAFGWKAVVAAAIVSTLGSIISYAVLFHMNATLFTAAGEGFRQLHRYGHAGAAVPEDSTPSPIPRALMPNSHWIIYADNDFATGARIFHARLASTSLATAQDASTSNQSQLEMQQNGGEHEEVRLLFSSIPATSCAAITGIDAKFDKTPARHFAATSQIIAGSCTTLITDASAFRASVLNASTLLATAVTPQTRLSTVLWQVGGLSWEIN